MLLSTYECQHSNTNYNTWFFSNGQRSQHFSQKCMSDLWHLVRKVYEKLITFFFFLFFFFFQNLSYRFVMNSIRQLFQMEKSGVDDADSGLMRCLKQQGKCMRYESHTYANSIIFTNSIYFCIIMDDETYFNTLMKISKNTHFTTSPNNGVLEIWYNWDQNCDLSDRYARGLNNLSYLLWYIKNVIILCAF